MDTGRPSRIIALLLLLSVTLWHSATARAASRLTLAGAPSRLLPSDVPTAVRAMFIAATEEASPKEELIVPTSLGGEDGETTPGDTQLSSDEGKEEETLLSGYEREEEGSRVISETYNTQTQGRLTGNLKAQRRLKREAAKKNRKPQKRKDKAKKEKNKPQKQKDKAKKEKNKPQKQKDKAKKLKDKAKKQKNKPQMQKNKVKKEKNKVKKEKNKVKKEKNKVKKEKTKVKKEKNRKNRWLDSINAIGNESTNNFNDAEDVFEREPWSLTSHNISCSEIGGLVQRMKESQRLLAIQLAEQCHGFNRKGIVKGDKHQKRTSGRKQGKKKKNRGKRQAEAGGADEEQDLEAELGEQREAERVEVVRKMLSAKRKDCSQQKREELRAAKVKSALLKVKWKSECRGTVGTGDQDSFGEQQQGRMEKEWREKTNEEPKFNEETEEVTPPGNFAW